MTFYLKYRPQTVSELDLLSVRKTLTALLSRPEIPHAFLFAGPRGAGKTSAARILAKAINCEHKGSGSIEPCNDCDSCRAITKGTHIDVIEMDAASNRGIDEIRALKQDIMLSPTSAKKKIYIIDEVHMLTTEAANALLKTLEEPPQHVVFILATTDPQKLPQTVLSRLSIVQFTKATEQEITDKLKRIVAAEKLNIEEEVYKKIFEISDGAFRDAVKILEQLSLDGDPITVTKIDTQFASGAGHVTQILEKLVNEGGESAVQLLVQLSKEGIDGKAVLNSLIDVLHTDLVKTTIKSDQKSLFTQQQIVHLLELLLEAKSRLLYAQNSFLPVEIALLKFSPQPGGQVKKDEILPQPVEVRVEKAVVTEAPLEHKTESTITPEAKPELTDTVILPPLKAGDEVSLDTWGKILLLTREKNAGVEALLRAAKPRGFDGNTLTIGVYFKFHKERLELPLTKTLFDEVVSFVFGSPVKTVFVLDEPPQKPVIEQSLQASQAPDIINAAKEIFGS